MFGVLVKVSIEEGRSDEAVKVLNEMIVPRVKASDGFVSGQWIHSIDQTWGVGLVIFNSEEAAKAGAADARQLPPGAPVEVTSAEIGKVVAQA
jgi:hypothetical protein